MMGVIEERLRAAKGRGRGLVGQAATVIPP